MRQQRLRFRTHGGARKGAGRPASGPRSIHHDERIRVVASEPIHITCRALPRVGSLRRDAIFAAVRAATIVVARHDDFRIIHVSVQRTHLHLLVEARSGRALTHGMCSFLISAARHINRAIRARGGRVFERYHARSLRTPREVRNCLAYVLNNWRHHGEHRRTSWLVDKYSSAIAFDGWKELGRGKLFTTPPDYAPLVVWRPRTWLVTTGWIRYGLVRLQEIPGDSKFLVEPDVNSICACGAAPRAARTSTRATTGTPHLHQYQFEVTRTPGASSHDADG